MSALLYDSNLWVAAPDSVLKLCETFAEHREHFRSGNYNEFQLRKQFLDPLFEALGWDMANSQGLAPQYRDVIHEDAIKIGPHVKAPDYESASNTADHLLPFRAAAQKRQDHGDFWWELRPCDYYQVLERAKIVFPDICKGPRFHLDTTGAYILKSSRSEF